jgi:multicomponent K+:H+ antiporter subunit F
MIYYASIMATIATSVAMMLSLFRLVVGPAHVDRILALDTMAINAIALIMMAGIIWGSTTYFEAAMLFAMVGFLATIAFCKYLLRGNIME